MRKKNADFFSIFKLKSLWPVIARASFRNEMDGAGKILMYNRLKETNVVNSKKNQNLVLD